MKKYIQIIGGVISIIIACNLMVAVCNATNDYKFANLLLAVILFTFFGIFLMTKD